MKKGYFQNRILTQFVFLFVLSFTPLFVFSQVKRYKSYEDYVSNYRGIAIKHMEKYKVPASITLAQGLLESGAGTSPLTLNSNNHFGIKCHNDGQGDKVYQADDGPNDCFRKYKKAEESFADHARFITQKKRYESLFELKITDYKGWSKGLQKAGYATDKTYADKLIKLIEDYELYLYDKKGAKAPPVWKDEAIIKQYYRHTPYKTYGLVYVIAANGDTYASIADEFGFKTKELCEYNETSADFTLRTGDIVYFQKKKSKADKPHYDHVVKAGESMYSISQFYGVKIKNLYQLNKKDFAYTPQVGDVLKLR